MLEYKKTGRNMNNSTECGLGTRTPECLPGCSCTVLWWAGTTRLRYSSPDRVSRPLVAVPSHTPTNPEAEPFYPLTASLYSSLLLTESIALLICVKWWGDCRHDQRFRVDGAVDSTSDVDRWERLYPRHGHHSLRGCHHF